MIRPTDHPTRIIIGSVVLFALVVVLLVPAWVLAVLAGWTLLGTLVALPLCRAIANADRHRAREQGEREPLADRSSVIFVSNHNGRKY